MTQEDEIEELQKELQLNPKSLQFVKLAELYLSREMNAEAETLVKQSLKFHPRSTSGLILLGRILKLKKQHAEAIKPLLDATKIATENWRAWLELAECYLELKNAKLALTAFKKVLFLNPTQAFARRAVAKLELLTADEYEEDLFQMQKLPETGLEKQTFDAANKTWPKLEGELLRAISYIDALIVRHETHKALDLLNQCSDRYGAHPEIESRKLKLSVFENVDFIQPKSTANASLAKKKLITEKQISALQMLLRRIEAEKNAKKTEQLST